MNVAAAKVGDHLFGRDARYDRPAATAATSWSDREEARRVLESAALRLALVQVSFAAGDRRSARLNARRALDLKSDSLNALRLLQASGD